MTKKRLPQGEEGVFGRCIWENGLFGAFNLNGANGSGLNFLELWKRAQGRSLRIARAATA